MGGTKRPTRAIALVLRGPTCYLVESTARVEDEEDMEKEQPDSLATVAVVSDKTQTPSHYAPSEIYSSSEPPPVSSFLRKIR